MNAGNMTVKNMPAIKSLIAPLTLAFAAAAVTPAQARDTEIVTDCNTVKTLANKAQASWYGPGFHGRKTANGEIFNMNAMTAAHKTLKLGTRILVENIENGTQVVLRVNDRGPYIEGRALDVSKKAADILGFREEGIAKVKMSICS